MLFGAVQESASGTSRHFAAAPNFGSDRREADMTRASWACRSGAFEPNRTPTALVALGSRPAVQRIVPGRGDGVFDAGEVIVEHFLGSRTGDDRGFAIGRRHGNLCGHEGAGQIGSIYGARHGSVSYCVPIWSLPRRFLNRTEVDPDHAFVFPTYTSVMSASYSGCPAHCFRLRIASSQLTATPSPPWQSLALSPRPKILSHTFPTPPATHPHLCS